MKYRAIIREAWVLTQENKKLIWWFAFIPALLSSLVSMVYISYQAAALWTSPYLRESATETHLLSSIIKKALELFNQNPSLGVFGIVMIVLVLLAYLLLPVFTQGALIQLVARVRAGEEVSIARGMSYGFSRFLQLFEYHTFIKTFSFIGIFTEATFTFRIFGPEPFKLFGWIFLFLILIGLFFTLLFTYSEYYIVIDKEGVFKSVLRSGGLVVRQWHHTLFMLLLMAVIIVRVGLNLLVAFLVPALVIAPIFLFTSLALAKIGAIIGAIAGLVVLYFASYFLGVFHVFTSTVWTFTFLDLTREEANAIDLHKVASRD
ncbi:MAG: hypothetical protein WC924_04820 [Candidatus Gracilibacteria bacterium]